MKKRKRKEKSKSKKEKKILVCIFPPLFQFDIYTTYTNNKWWPISQNSRSVFSDGNLCIIYNVLFRLFPFPFFFSFKRRDYFFCCALAKKLIQLLLLLIIFFRHPIIKKKFSGFAVVRVSCICVPGCCVNNFVKLVKI